MEHFYTVHEKGGVTWSRSTKIKKRKNNLLALDIYFGFRRVVFQVHSWKWSNKPKYISSASNLFFFLIFVERDEGGLFFINC